MVRSNVEADVRTRAGWTLLFERRPVISPARKGRRETETERTERNLVG